MKPYYSWQDGSRSLVIHQGHVLDILARLPERSVHVIVTSPPYYGLRHYPGPPPTLWGGDPDCKHTWSEGSTPGKDGGKRTEILRKKGKVNFQIVPDAQWSICERCGAWLGHLGREPLHDCLAWARGEPPCATCYICHIRAVAAGLHRVLRDDGTFWLNIDDSHVANQARGLGLPYKSALGIPWRATLALQADGWLYRVYVPWIKRAPMPESVGGRPVHAIEPLLMFTKTGDSFYDLDAILLPQASSSEARAHRADWRGKPGFADAFGGVPPGGLANQRGRDTSIGRRWRNSDPWVDDLNERIAELRLEMGRLETIRASGGALATEDGLLGIHEATAQAKVSHFAAYPEALITPLLLAAVSQAGVCPTCGTPWERLVLREDMGLFDRSFRSTYTAQTPWIHHGEGPTTLAHKVRRTTLGWRPGCVCGAPKGMRPNDLDLIATPLGRATESDPSPIIGRRGLGRPRAPDEGVRLITRHEQRQYAQQLRHSPHRDTMAAEAGDAFAHYTRTDTSGARPVPPDLLEAWIERGWLEMVVGPEWEPPETVPGVVLDPFLGRGTTLVVAYRLGLSGIGIELSEEYCEYSQDWIDEVRGRPVVTAEDGKTWQQTSLFEEKENGTTRTYPATAGLGNGTSG